jgi:hypothetical protein
MKNWNLEGFRVSVTKEQCKDTGMAMVLILLLVTLITKRDVFMFCAIGAHILNMVVPQLYRLVAVLWLGLANLLGTIMTKVLLAIVFLAVVTPVGLCRRLFKADPLKLKAFKAGSESVMQKRNHTFNASDIMKPY